MLSSEELHSICDEMAEGKSLRSICKDMGLAESSVRRWIAADEEAMAHSVRAREFGCDSLADECLEIADGEGDPQDKRIKIDTRIRLIGKWSQRYADKPAVDARTVNVNVYDLDRLESDRLEQLEAILTDARRSEGGTGEALPPPVH